MNYRHAYHAGNFADVMKHAALALILERLRQKDKPFFVLDTHAGIGRYDLASEQALKTGEYQNGIGRLFPKSRLEGLQPYFQAIRALNLSGDLRFYPGSPCVARHFLRPQDRMAVIELHPQDVFALGKVFAKDRQVSVHHMDAYQALKAFLPPQERRGLVLIDPPFEKKDEFDRLLQGLGHALTRWPSGIYCIWYPIKDVLAVDAFHRKLADLVKNDLLVAEIYNRAIKDSSQLNGSGLAIFNPPWQLDCELETLLAALTPSLALEEGARSRITWLQPPL